MFKSAIKSDLCQVSLTGMRAIVLLGLLIEQPRSIEEIRESFLSYNIMEENNSNDIIRIDINTLRYIGCKISRADKKNNYKYKLISHPYSIAITLEEVEIVKRAYKLIKNKSSIKTLLEYDNLFRKIAQHVSDEEIKQNLLGISALKSIKTELIKTLIAASNEKRIIKIEYQSPTAKNPSIMEVLTTDVVFQNEKIYLLGTDIFSKKAVMLQVKRILSIISGRKNNGDSEAKTTLIKFKLSEFGINGLEQNEKIIGKEDNQYLIEGEYHNEFIAIQRILSFGSTCTVIEPIEIREKVVSLLKNMREVYRNDQ